MKIEFFFSISIKLRIYSYDNLESRWNKRGRMELYHTMRITHVNYSCEDKKKFKRAKISKEQKSKEQKSTERKIIQRNQICIYITVDLIRRIQ